MTAYLSVRASTTPQAQRVLGATPANLGQQVGTAVTYSTGGNARSNYATTFRGTQFRVCGDAVYRSVDDFTTQTSVFALTGGVSAGNLGGLYILSSDGVPRLLVSWLDTAGTTFRYASSLTGLSGSWTTVANAGAYYPVGFPVVRGNTLRFYVELAGSIGEINPCPGSFSTYSP